MTRQLSLKCSSRITLSGSQELIQVFCIILKFGKMYFIYLSAACLLRFQSSSSSSSSSYSFLLILHPSVLQVSSAGSSKRMYPRILWSECIFSIDSSGLDLQAAAEEDLTPQQETDRRAVKLSGIVIHSDQIKTHCFSALRQLHHSNNKSLMQTAHKVHKYNRTVNKYKSESWEFDYYGNRQSAQFNCK